MITTDLLIIGAGPGGMTAALTAARYGLKTVILDENPAPGGQIYRRTADRLASSQAGRGDPNAARGRLLKAGFEAAGRTVTRLQTAEVWGLFPDRTAAVSHGDGSFRISYRKLIIAAGAHDRPVPFPGWTLPGVYTAGGAQRLVKTMGVLPGQRVVLAGTGPLQIALAAQILRSGGRIEALFEAGRIGNPLPYLPGALSNPVQLSELAGYLKTLALNRTRLRTGRVVIEARGLDRVEEVATAAVDAAWRPLPGSRRWHPADALCLGYGLVPSAELTLLAGCEHRHRPELGGWVPVRDPLGRTTADHVYAIGDGAGVAGSRAAILEGEQAALGAAFELGLIDLTELRRKSLPIQLGLRRLGRLKKALDRLTTPGPGLHELADDETIICRCEGVTLGRIKEALAGDDRSLNDLKRRTRCGMGRCQGRICGSILAVLGAGRWQPFSRRPPVRPIGLGLLAHQSRPGELGADHAA